MVIGRVRAFPTAAGGRVVDLAFDRVITDHLAGLVERRPAVAMGEVDLDARLRVLRKLEAQDAAVRRNGHFRMHLVLVECDGVIACRRLLGRFGKIRTVALAGFASAPEGAQRTRRRRNQHVAQLAAVRAAQVGEAEALDELAAVAIADIPAFIRAELDHAERYGSAGKILAHVAGANERVNVINGLLGRKC